MLNMLNSVLLIAVITCIWRWV